MVYIPFMLIKVGVVIIPHEIGTVTAHLMHKETEIESLNNLPRSCKWQSWDYLHAF